MVGTLSGVWKGIEFTERNSYTCGYCGNVVGPSEHYRNNNGISKIFICPKCNFPTFVSNDRQIPGPLKGGDIEHLPEGIKSLYDEARKCLTINAYTSTVLACRKLLMNISVSKGAEGGKTFAFYVTFLEENHYIPPESREWVDHIRKKGNEATHEIPSISREDAIELIDLTEMLLRIIYELPGKMTRRRE
ncbi:DUF4145 domain-containing protein [Lysinibacillus irui]|uniref:DUF4145 domain-containing protein n=1 Tax=Lysinibacillus irui TaxID=2998077 RepID=UPI002AD349B7|nr:DUF4145 domain-containing protein [Lysinibacillus irui]MEA0563287.1 DUF4145 domain-containing protein [Lysinibacillus irui]